jgi:hypothetical protein
VTELPKPRNIRRNWHVVAITPAEAEALLGEYGCPHEGAIAARRWKVTRGRYKGDTKRIDVLYANGRTASVRFANGMDTLRMGLSAAI